MINLCSYLHWIYNNHENTPLAMSMMLFPKRFNWRMKTHFKCGQYYFIICSSARNTKDKVNSIHLSLHYDYWCYLIASLYIYCITFLQNKPYPSIVNQYTNPSLNYFLKYCVSILDKWLKIIWIAFLKNIQRDVKYDMFRKAKWQKFAKI